MALFHEFAWTFHHGSFHADEKSMHSINWTGSIYSFSVKSFRRWKVTLRLIWSLWETVILLSSRESRVGVNFSHKSIIGIVFTTLQMESCWWQQLFEAFMQFNCNFCWVSSAKNFRHKTFKKPPWKRKLRRCNLVEGAQLSRFCLLQKVSTFKVLTKETCV